MFNKENTVKIMNEFGKKKLPFLFIIDFDFKNSIILRANAIDESKIKYSFNSELNNKVKKLNNKIDFKIIPPSFNEFEKAFNRVQKEIKAGNTYLLNLTFSSEIKGNFDLYDVYESAKAPYKLWLKDKFTVFSPETFIKITESKIFSYPMKGTLDADIPDAKNIILNDRKETAEHYTIVDLIRNDLNQIAKNVKVVRFRYIDKIRTNRKNLLQLSSEISGELPADYYKNIGTILDKL
ncbi:MAG: aminodeoxychorismate synthase component I, partial [Bacteroidales bacterium]|nr:aminodeoxychorismate synthase component I [Bacteroidales bacterium]